MEGFTELVALDLEVSVTRMDHIILFLIGVAAALVSAERSFTLQRL